MEFMMKLGTALKLARVRAGLRQTDVAKELGIESTYLSAVESGRKRPSLFLVEQIATVLRTSDSDIFQEAINLERIKP